MHIQTQDTSVHKEEIKVSITKCCESRRKTNSKIVIIVAEVFQGADI